MTPKAIVALTLVFGLVTLMVCAENHSGPNDHGSTISPDNDSESQDQNVTDDPPFEWSEHIPGSVAQGGYWSYRASLPVTVQLRIEIYITRGDELTLTVYEGDNYSAMLADEPYSLDDGIHERCYSSASFVYTMSPGDYDLVISTSDSHGAEFRLIITATE